MPSAPTPCGAAPHKDIPRREAIHQNKAVPREILQRARRRSIVALIVTILLIAAIVINMRLGQFTLTLSDIYRALGYPIGIADAPADPLAMPTLWNIRFPRIVLGLLVGAALAVAGAVMQAVFSNPLAEPGVIGVSAGSAVGASLAIVFAPHVLGGFSVPIAAFVTGLIAAFLVYALSMSAGKAEPLTLVLTGIAVTAVATALTSVATYIAPTTARDQIVFWQMGSLASASWLRDGIVAVVVLGGLVWALMIAGKLDILALGDKAAEHIGLNVAAVRLCAITLATLLTAAAVAYAGVIAFVGLIVPHVMRLLIGPLNRYLIPLSMLGGALLISVADLAARMLVPFADLPIGIFTALVGGPTFFAILRYGIRGIRSMG